MLGQRLPIAFERLDISCPDARGLLVRRMEDQRRRVLDPRRGSEMLDQFREQAFRQAFPARLLGSLLHPLYLGSGRQDLENPVEIDAIVPDVKRAHRGIIRHTFTVRARGLLAAFAPALSGKSI